MINIETMNMKVICKKNDDLIHGPIELLTLDKIYHVLKIEQDEEIKLYFIEDNIGEKRWFDSTRFIDIADVRQEKLNDLGI